MKTFFVGIKKSRSVATLGMVEKGLWKD